MTPVEVIHFMVGLMFCFFSENQSDHQQVGIKRTKSQLFVIFQKCCNIFATSPLRIMKLLPSVVEKTMGSSFRMAGLRQSELEGMKDRRFEPQGHVQFLMVF